ncbi:unnamed protein product, partial [Didymodactylos carnosus]
MGSPLAPILADVFMSKQETRIEDMTENKPVVYLRYVDDVFCVFPKEEDAEKFLHTINIWHDNLKFTIEREKQRRLPFLDVMVIGDDVNKAYET